MATYGYLQTLLYCPSAKDGHAYVYLANTTTEAVIYDPQSGEPINQPLAVDSEGFVEGFLVEADIYYDLYIYDFLNSLVLTRDNLVLNGSSGGLPGNDGKSVYLQVLGDGSARIYDELGNSTIIKSGTDGIDGTNGTNGNNGTNGTNGTNGVSLEAIAVDGTVDTGRIIYKLSNSPDWTVAGDILPNGMGQAKINSSDTLGYLDAKLGGSDGVSMVLENGLIVFKLDTAIVTRIDNMETNLEDVTERVVALESVSPVAEMHFGGTIGATTVVIPHTLGTDNLFVTCYNTIDNSVIYESVIVSASQVSISNIAPLEATNQIKVVLMRAPLGV